MNRRDTETQRFKGQKMEIKELNYFFRAAVFILKISAFLCLGGLILVFNLKAQNLPDEIRGYKVHEAKISVTNNTDRTGKNDNSEAFARLTEPELIDTSLSGLTFEISAEIDPLDYKGKVDFLTFNNFKVNGLDVEIGDYTNSFEFKKNRAIALPTPIKIFLGSSQALRSALGELRDSKEFWTVTGTVFVFGRFKKFGFNVKRVVPVAVNVQIKNPLRQTRILPNVIPSN